MATKRNVLGALMALMVTSLFMVPLVPVSAFSMGAGDLSLRGTVARDVDGATTSEMALRGGGLRAPDFVEVDTTLDADATIYNTGRNIVKDDRGTLHVVYSSNGEIWYSTSMNGGQTWNTAINISNDTGTWDSATPAIATNGSRVYVVWTDVTATFGDNEYVHLRYTDDNGTSWTPARDAVPSRLYQFDQRPYYPSIAATRQDDVYVVWMRNEDDPGETWDEDVIYFRRSTDAGANFQAEVMVSDEDFDSVRPTVEAEGNNVIVVWQAPMTSAQAPRDDYEIWWRRSGNRGVAWANIPTRMTINNIDDTNPSVILSGQNITVVWESFDTSSNTLDIAVRNSTNQGTTWDTAPNAEPKYLHNIDADSYSPTLARNGDHLYCIWVTDVFDANGDLIMSEMNTTTNWTKPFRLTNDGQGHRWPSLHVNVGDTLDWVWVNATASPYSVLYDYFTVTGLPNLDWTGEAGYVSDAVEPDTGMTGHTYTFKVDYSDPDNDAPATGYPSVLIDKNMNDRFDLPDERFGLVEENAADTTYTDGKVYQLSTRFSMVGQSKYVFEAMDVSKAKALGPATVVTPGPTILGINEPPSLAWTEEKGYVNDGVEPDVGAPTTEFEFRVIYTDVLNESPKAGFPKIFLDMNEDGDFTDPEDENFTMAQETALDTTYWNGKIYTYSKNFGPGNYSYYMYVEDQGGFNAVTDVMAGPEVGWIGVKPVLSLTGETGYTADGVEPDTGYDTTEFVFKVRYTDADNDMPAEGYPRVGIDLNIDGNVTTGEWFAMEEADTADNITTDGKVYLYNAVIGTTGTYSYKFDARDINLAPADQLGFSGPTVSGVNAPPLLTFLGTPGYDSDGLEPETGFLNYTDFIYRVVYEDVEDHLPMAGNPMIWVDLDIDGQEDTGEWFPMEEVDPADTMVSDGKTYSYTTKLGTLGLHNYKFKAKDSVGGVATGSPTSMMNGPMVMPRSNMPPALLWVGLGDYNDSGVHPKVADLDDDFVYKVSYIDVDGDMPGANWPKVYIDEEGDGLYNGTLDIIGTMEPEDVNDTDVTNGKVYIYTTKLPVVGSNYTYMFKAEDALGSQADASGSLHGMVWLGPKVVLNKDPLLKFTGAVGFVNDGVDPDKGPEGTEFTFRVVYKDAENEAPLTGKVYLRLDSDKDGEIDDTDLKVEMTVVDATELNYSVGEEYMVKHVISEAGNYGYRFEANDTAGNPAEGPASGYTKGPTVAEVLPDQPPELVFTGEVDYVVDGVHPFKGEKGAKFVFRVKYIDVDNDAPLSGHPVLTIGETKLNMTEADPTDLNYRDGKIYTLEHNLNEVKDYTYSFSVVNVKGQEDSIGPFDGPVVVKKTDGGTTPVEDQMLESWMWLVIVILAAVVCALVGYTAAKPKAAAAPPRRRVEEDYDEEAAAGEGDYGATDYDEGQVPDETPYEEEVPTEEAPAPEPGPEVTPEPEPEVVPGPVVEEAPGPPVTEEQTPAAEETAPPKEEGQPATEERPEAEEKAKDEKVKDDLDDILAKLT